MSLYLKYRPQDFRDVVGQEHVLRSIQNALKYQAIHHAYVFSGPRGTGKTSLARIIAKAINCTNLTTDFNPCNDCLLCTHLNAGRLIDLIEIDAASNRGIDEIRELREKIQFAPSQGKSKVYIIDEVHMLTKEAFNALLKTLEEPPAHAYFILATTEAHKIPETILSRCQQFNFQRITPEDIVKRLYYIAGKEGIKTDPEALQLIAHKSSGGLRDAIGLFEQMTLENEVNHAQVLRALGLTGQKKIDDFFNCLMNQEAREGIEMINQINNEGQNLQQFTGELLDYLREQMLLGVQQKKDVTGILRWLDIFTQAKQQIPGARMSQLPLEIAIIKACYSFEKGEMQPEPVKIKEEVVSRQITESSSSSSLPELNIDEIKRQWQRIIDRIETPFVRMSFLDSEPIKFEKNILHLNFSSASFRDKIANASNQALVIKALEEIFNIKISLKLDLKKIELQPNINKNPTKENIPTALEMAEEVFGIEA